MKAMRNLIDLRVRIWRIAVPVWAIVLSSAMLAATAGQAIGPVLSGSVTGATGLVVGQAVVLDTDTATHTAAHSVTGGEDSVIVVSDDGTGFTAAIEAFRGQSATVRLDLKNKGDQVANALVTIQAPSGVTVDVEESNPVTSSTVSAARLGANRWLLKVPASLDNDDPDIDIFFTAEPGTFVVKAFITQITPGQ